MKRRASHSPFRRRALGALLAAALLGSACSGSSEGDGAPKEARESTDPVTELSVGELEAGNYLFEGFGFPLEIDLEDGWVAEDIFDEFFYLRHEDGRVIGAALPTYVIDEKGEELPIVGQSADDIAETISANVGGKVTGGDQVGGLDGPTVAFEMPEIKPLFGGDQGTFENAIAPALRFTIVTVGDKLVLAIAGGEDASDAERASADLRSFSFR